MCVWTFIDVGEGLRRDDTLATIYKYTMNNESVEFSSLNHFERVFFRVVFTLFRRKVDTGSSVFDVRNLGIIITLECKKILH